MSIEDAYNFRRVDDLVTTSGFLTDTQVRDLGSQGYDAVINLLPDDHERAVAGESAIVRAQGLDYVHIPVDFDRPTRADLDAFAAAMDGLQGRQVHVHCAANYRVTAFYSLYAQSRGWWTPTEADAFVRGIWDPGERTPWAAFMSDTIRRDCA